MLQEPLNFLLILLWAVAATYVMLRSWGSRSGRLGITITYVIFFAASYWLPTIVVLLPWYDPLFEIELTLLGFYESLVAIIAFAIGTLLVTKILKGFHFKMMHKQGISPQPAAVLPNLQQLPAIYIWLGLIFTFAVLPFVNTVPTLSSFSFGVSNLFQVGLLLLCWQGFQTKNKLELGIACVLAAIWPFISVATTGFLVFAISFGVLFTVFAFSLLEKPARFLLLFIVIAYLGLSFFQSYLSVRHDIRSALWYTNQQVTIHTRTNVVVDLIESFELFDITNPMHLYAIDVRLNMSHLTGRTVQRIESGAVDYSYGQTMSDALLMLIPRMVWPDKPVAVGGQALVRQYAGYDILSGSIAPGHLMEFYLNFGTVGVAVGFLLMGTLVGLLDEYCATQLRNGNLLRFAMFLVPALGLLESTTTYFVTLVGATVSALITVYIVNIFVRDLLLRNHRRADSLTKVIGKTNAS